MNDRKWFVLVSPVVREKRGYASKASPSRYFSRCAQIIRLEGLFGPINQNSEVVTGHAKRAAQLVFTSLLKEHSLQQASIFFWELVESLPNLLLKLPPSDGFRDAHTRIDNGIRNFAIHRKLSSPRSMMLM